MNTSATPLRTYSQSQVAGSPGRAGSGARLCATSWRGLSSRHAGGRDGPGGRAQAESTSPVAATNSQDASGMHHSLTRRGSTSFF